MKLLLLLFGIVILMNAAAASRDVPATRLLYRNTSSTEKASATERQKLTCFDGLDQGGRRVEFQIDFLADLGQSPYWFDNTIVSCCFNGIYLLYANINYNSANLDGAVFAEVWGENDCFNVAPLFQRVASSLRLAGFPSNYKYPSFNLYEGTFYQGRELFFSYDAARLYYVNFGRSAIITGCSPWTVYDDVDFQGDSTCIYPSHTYGCYPGFFENERLGSWSGRIASIRRGCFAKTRVYHYGEGIVNGTGNASPFQKGTFFSPPNNKVQDY